MVKSSSGKAGLRSFKVIMVGKHGGCKTKFREGKYVSRTPVQSARKAFSSLCRRKRVRGVCTLFVTVQETTQGSNKKLFSYKLNRYRLKVPVIRFEGTDKEYVNEFSVSSKSVNVPEVCRRPGQTRGRMITKSRASKRRLGPNNARRLRSKRNRR